MVAQARASSYRTQKLQVRDDVVDVVVCQDDETAQGRRTNRILRLREVEELMRVPVAGGREELVLKGIRPFLWSVTDTGIVFVTREPNVDAIDVYRFSDQRVARVGRLGFPDPGGFRSLTVSRDGRWALGTKMVRFDSDLMRLDNFR